jgi:predicted Zn finger-like uncharacterized protein
VSLVTKCTGCGTTFRVTQPQLEAHGGKVRCGTCKTVFDGRQGLLVLPGAGVEPAANQAGEIAGFELKPVDPAVAMPAAAPAPAPMLDADYGPAPEQLSLEDQPHLAQERRRARVWALGVALLALALAGQAAYRYRADLAVQYPGLRPYLAQFCDLLRCTLAPPQSPRQIAIEASDLQATDTARPGLIQLTATLRNHAGHDLGFPALDLVLTNTKEHTLARRIFLPAEYLEREHNVLAGIPANAEITVRLDLDTGDLNPAGFRLDLLPAPAH